MSAPLAWDRFVADPAAPADVDAISDTVGAVFAALGKIGPQAIDFSALRPDACHPEHLAAALRSSFMAREAIPSWEHGLLVAIDACALAGTDPRDALFGML